MKTHHLDGYNLLNTVGYQAATCATGESCGEAEHCQTLAEAGPQTCGAAADFCRASEQADRLGICDAFPRRCEYAIACVQRTALARTRTATASSTPGKLCDQASSHRRSKVSPSGEGGVPATP